MSGDATVLFTADSAAGVSTDEITADNILTFTDDGSLDPAELTVDVGEPFGVQGAEGAEITSVLVGCASSQLVYAGEVSGFVITDAGSFPIVDELDGAELGLITAE